MGFRIYNEVRIGITLLVRSVLCLVCFEAIKLPLHADVGGVKVLPHTGDKGLW